MKRINHSDKGVMLVLTLGLLGILWFLVLGSATYSVNSMRASRGGLASEQSLWAAESGAAYGVALLNDDPDSKAPSKAIKLEKSNASFTLKFLTGKEAPVSLPDQAIYVESVGQSLGGPQRKVAVVVLPSKSEGSLFSYSVFANQIDLSGNSLLASFNSNGRSTGDKGNAGTNSNGKGSIRLSGSSTIKGRVDVGPKGETKDSPQFWWQPSWGNENVVWKHYNTETLGESNLEQPVDFPSVESPASGREDFKVNYQGLDLKPGSYDKLRASGGGELRLYGGTYVFDDLDFSGGSSLSVVGNEQVTIYVNKSLDVSGNVFLNRSKIAKNLVFVLDKKASIKIQGGSTVFATIYAPESKTKISGNSSLYGAIVADDIDISGSSQVYYDEDLLKNSPSIKGIEGGTGGSSGPGGLTILSSQRF